MPDQEYDPQRYSGEEGAIPLRAVNIAPMRGERIVGYVPYGLVAVRADNMKGKSRLLSAVTAIPLRTLKPEMVTVTRGETVAEVGLGVAELRIEEWPTGDGGQTHKKVSRSGVSDEGAIIELPEVIDLMITGGNHVDPDADWRTRMKALGDFRPVEPTEARLRKIAGPVLPEPNHDVLSWLLEAHARVGFRTVLEAAEALGGPRGELNRRALLTEGQAEAAGHELSRLGGEASQLLDQAARASGIDIKDRALTERRLLEETEAPKSVFSRLRSAEMDLARAETSRQAREGEENRRAALRGTHGERPNTAAEEAELTAARERETAADSALGVRREELARARVTSNLFETQAEGTRQELSRARESFAEVSGQLFVFLGSDDGWPPEDFGRSVEEFRQELLALENRAEAAARARKRLAVLEGAVRAADEAHSLAHQAALGKRAERETAERILAAARDRVNVWESVSGLLASPVEGSTAEEVAGKRAEVERLREQAGIAALAEPYREARAKVAAARERVDGLKEAAKRLRAEVVEVWNRLGEVMTEALRSNAVRVRGRAIEVCDEDGTWYDVADNVQLSKGRLRRAFLDLFLDEHPGGVNVVVPEEIVLLIGPFGRQEISARAAAKKFRLLYEEPANCEVPQLYWYGAASAGEEVGRG